MNASYRHNTCKSRGSVSVRFGEYGTATGGWVSNTYPTWPAQGNSLPKGRLMPHGIERPHGLSIKDLSVRDGDAFH
jgi:hypothetical protein